MRQAGEPSVEEILDSIKKVIARDNRDSAAEQRRERETAGVTPDQAEAATVDDHGEDGLILELTDSAEFETDSAVDDEPEGDLPLVTEQARVSMQESLAALAMLADPGVQPQIVRSGETSLESLARELLRPALSDWLDKNLPAMVERMVATEIARIVGKRG